MSTGQASLSPTTRQMAAGVQVSSTGTVSAESPETPGGTCAGPNRSPFFPSSVGYMLQVL